MMMGWGGGGGGGEGGNPFAKVASHKSVSIPLLSRDKKNNVYPCKPQFYNIKVGFKGV